MGILHSYGHVSTIVWLHHLQTKLDENYTRMLHAILNKSWKQHFTKGHAPIVLCLNGNILGSEIELRSCYYIYFLTNTYGNDINPLISLAMG